MLRPKVDRNGVKPLFPSSCPLRSNSLRLCLIISDVWNCHPAKCDVLCTADVILKLVQAVLTKSSRIIPAYNETVTCLLPNAFTFPTLHTKRTDFYTSLVFSIIVINSW